MAAPFHVLVVEDDDLIRAFVVDEMRDAGITALEAASGEDALQLIRERHLIDALFTDIRLGPGADGWDVGEAFRDAYPNRPVVYASGYAPGPMRTVPGSLFIPKPYKADAVIDTLFRLRAAQRGGPAARRGGAAEDELRRACMA